MTITIYGSIGSRASRCLWTAEEIGLRYEWQPVNRGDGSSRMASYLAISPTGMFPALTDGGVAITESFAINQYLASRYGCPGLFPVDPAQQAKVLQWSFWSATEIEPAIGAIFAERILKPEAERDMRHAEAMLSNMSAKFPLLEAALQGREYLLGAFTLADINIAVQSFVILDHFNQDLAAFPNIRAWSLRCRARPARQKIEALAAN